MRYKLKVLSNNDKNTSWKTYHVAIDHMGYPDIKAVVEKLTVSLEENIHPITIHICAEKDGYDFDLYFTRTIAKEWLHELSPCIKTGRGLKFTAVEWDGI